MSDKLDISYDELMKELQKAFKEKEEQKKLFTNEQWDFILKAKSRLSWETILQLWNKVKGWEKIANAEALRQRCVRERQRRRLKSTTVQ
jgi:hypothetical protein